MVIIGDISKKSHIGKYESKDGNKALQERINI